MHTPTRIFVRPLDNPEPARFGLYLTASAIARIRFRVDLLTPLRSSNARPTVSIDIFASRAIPGMPRFFICRKNVNEIKLAVLHKLISGQPKNEAPNTRRLTVI